MNDEAIFTTKTKNGIENITKQTNYERPHFRTYNFEGQQRPIVEDNNGLELNG